MLNVKALPLALESIEQVSLLQKKMLVEEALGTLYLFNGEEHNVHQEILPIDSACIKVIYTSAEFAVYKVPPTDCGR